MDPLRDEALIYEDVLREECGVKTRLDVYQGLPHGFWLKYTKLTATKRFLKDMVEGVGWLLGKRAKGSSEAELDSRVPL